MPSMIETLIGAGVQRPDEKRLVPSRRPLPNRPRDLFELFVTLGAEATIPSLFEACDLRQTDPRHITFVALNRWPTADELAEQPTPYNARPHLRSLVLGQEFRRSLIRRICDAYPERPRMLYVQIPRCAGEHFLTLANAMHAIIPDGLDRWKRGDQANFISGLGIYLARFNQTRSITWRLPVLAPFIQAAVPPQADTALPWSINPPPKRPGDRLFTIVREPTGLIFSQVNAILTRLQAPAEDDDPSSAAWRKRLVPLPAADDVLGYKALGRAVLALLTTANPICQALGDGTAASALEACRLSDIEIADLGTYHDWVKYSWDVEPEPASNTSNAILAKQDLDERSAAHLTRLTAEDCEFYAQVAAILPKPGDTRTSARGRDL